MRTSSPYGHRCKCLHDPRITAYPALGCEESNAVVVVEHCTKPKRSGDTIPDRLWHRNLNSTRQENPLIAPFIWETRLSSSEDASLEAQFRDTYNLVCNAGIGVNISTKTIPASSPRKRRTGGGRLYADVAAKSVAQQGVMLGELQRLCIVLHMHGSNDAHLDFVYAPTDCEFFIHIFV